MKTALSYARISTDEQSNFSIEGQLRANEDYAKKHGIQVVESFIDDGYSAATFNRPEWKRLEKILSDGKVKVDFLIVHKYDRLIRNVMEAFVLIDKLEQKWNIRLVSVAENFSIDPHSPFFFKMRADLFVNAEFERRVISDRTKFGVWVAKSNGRFLGVAPYGYRNARDERNKPIIVVNDTEAEIVVQVFEDYATGLDIVDVLTRAKEAGFTRKGNIVIQRMLANPVYVGRVLVPKYKDEAEKLVEGIHQPIVDLDLWRRVEARRLGKRKPIVKAKNDEFPLRGVVLCQSCQSPMTGANSKGKNKWYGYYKCNTCKGENHSVSRSHEELTQVLRSLSIEGPELDRMIEQSRKALKVKLNESTQTISKIESDISTLGSKIESLELKYIENKVDHEMYSKWMSEFRRELNLKRVQLSNLERVDEKAYDIFEMNRTKLGRLDEVWKGSSVSDKQMLVRLLFPQGLEKSNTGYRTPKVNSLFSYKANKVGGLEVYRTSIIHPIYQQTPTCTRGGT